jgi:hypothetical protein
MKLTRRLGLGLLEELNAGLLSLAVERKLLRSRRRLVGKRVRAISAARVRGRRALGTLDRLTAEIAERAEQRVREARARGARRDARRKRASVALVERLERELEAAEQILAQTELRLAGQRTIPDRRVSLVDPDARPIRIGSPARPTEFGYKARGRRHRRGLRDRRHPRSWRSHRWRPARGRDQPSEAGRDAGALAHNPQPTALPT